MSIPAEMAGIRRHYRRRGRLAAIAFHRCIELVTAGHIGDIAGFKPPQPLGEGQDIISAITYRWAIPLITAVADYWRFCCL